MIFSYSFYVDNDIVRSEETDTMHASLTHSLRSNDSRRVFLNVIEIFLLENNFHNSIITCIINAICYKMIEDVLKRKDFYENFIS